MRLTLRQANHMDQLFGEYLDLAEYESWTSRPTPAVTGFVSACCRSETRILTSGSVACVKCNQLCDTRSWWSPLSGSTSRGGWNPGVPETELKMIDGVSVEVPTGRTWNVLYVNETRTRNAGASEARLLHGVTRIRELTHLFSEPPRGVSFTTWHRTKLAWQGWLALGDYQEVAGLAISAGRAREDWTASNVEAWTNEGRELAHARLERAKDRPKEHPWSKVAWLVYQAETNRRRKRAA